MPCEPIPNGFMCARGGRAPKCSVTGCNKRSTKQCDYPLRGSKAGQTCSKHLCDAHAVAQGEVTRIDSAAHLIKAAGKRNKPIGDVGKPHYDDSVDFCPAHAEIARTSP